MSEQINDYEKSLLKSLKDGRKYLDMGQSPVSAIEAAFKLNASGFIKMDDNLLHLTPKGIKEIG